MVMGLGHIHWCEIRTKFKEPKTEGMGARVKTKKNVMYFFEQLIDNHE